MKPVPIAAMRGVPMVPTKPFQPSGTRSMERLEQRPKGALEHERSELELK
jgi:hypothetical protein